MWGAQHSISGEYAHGGDQLNRRHSESLSVGRGCLIDGFPVLPGSQQATGFAGEAASGFLPKSEAQQRPMIFLAPEQYSNLNRTDVARKFEHPGRIDHAIGPMIADRHARNFDAPATRVDALFRADRTGVQCGSDQKRLEH